MRRLEAIVLACIASATHGCMSSTFGCDPPSRDFSIDAELTEAELTMLMADFGLASRDELDCTTVCAFAHRRDEGWEASDVESCVLELEDESAADPEAIVGTVQCDGRAIEYYCEGRRPLGHIQEGRAALGLADHLARCAYLEAAAVTAFDDLVAALVRWDAPSSLIERCRRARAQEVEHATAVGAAAQLRGACVALPSRIAHELSPRAVALDNAVEGCVLEAWAALRARWIAEHAREPELRTLYGRIAADELEHAQLSWDLHAWLLAQLDAGTRAEVEAALAGALARLPRLAAEQAASMPAALGLPVAATFRAMAQEFCARLAA